MKNCYETVKADDKLAKQKRSAKVKSEAINYEALKFVLSVVLALLREKWWLNKEIV